MKPDIHVASRLISTLALFCFISSLVAQTVSYKWAETDVAYIITDQERDAFNRLLNDDDRERFIEQFWLRRDPTPDTVENEYNEGHYRRIAYANERFGTGVPGRKTDRGWIYIKFGRLWNKEVEPPPCIHSSNGATVISKASGTT